MQTCSGPAAQRRPPCLNLHDVFVNIRDDEVEHVKTMHACQGITIAQDLAARRKDTPAAALEPPALHAAK